LARPSEVVMNYKKLAEFCLHPEQIVAYETGSTLVGYSIKKKEDEWLMMIRVKTSSGKFMVAFIGASTIDTCWELFYTAVTKTSFTLKWKLDNFSQV